MCVADRFCFRGLRICWVLPDCYKSNGTRLGVVCDVGCVGAACDVGWGGEVVMLCFWLIVVMTGCW